MGPLGRLWKPDHLSSKLLSAYGDGQVSSRQREETEGHLEACARCRQESDAIQETRDLLRTVPLVSVPRSFALVRAPAVAPRRLSWRPVLSLRVAASAAMAALAVLLIGDATGLQGPGGASVPIQVGMAEPQPLITSGTLPSPELAVPLAPLADEGTASTPAVAPADPALGAAPTGEPLAGEGSTRFDLWPLEAGLLGLVLLLITASLLLPRLRRG